ncbi:MAG: hypothetical protein PWQ57_2526, partial [Desulfovibrionales bacterium]|nr:hypothetical protein [Desulfovibrionales bacterium]
MLELFTRDTHPVLEMLQRSAGECCTIYKVFQCVIYATWKRSLPPAGPYLSTQDAAAYLSFNYDHFRLLARKHQIPRRGPSKNRFAVTDLDRWMTDPHCFLEKP